LIKAKLDERDSSIKRSKIHPHVLREFFRTRLGAVIPIDIIEALMGHEAYLTGAYHRYDEQQLTDFYKGESALSIFNNESEAGKEGGPTTFSYRSLAFITGGRP